MHVIFPRIEVLPEPGPEVAIPLRPACRGEDMILILPLARRTAPISGKTAAGVVGRTSGL
jgi:hypothetical protein